MHALDVRTCIHVHVTVKNKPQSDYYICNALVIHEKNCKPNSCSCIFWQQTDAPCVHAWVQGACEAVWGMCMVMQI